MDNQDAKLKAIEVLKQKRVEIAEECARRVEGIDRVIAMLMGSDFKPVFRKVETSVKDLVFNFLKDHPNIRYRCRDILHALVKEGYVRKNFREEISAVLRRLCCDRSSAIDREIKSIGHRKNGVAFYFYVSPV